MKIQLSKRRRGFFYCHFQFLLPLGISTATQKSSTASGSRSKITSTASGSRNKISSTANGSRSKNSSTASGSRIKNSSTAAMAVEIILGFGFYSYSQKL